MTRTRETIDQKPARRSNADAFVEQGSAFMTIEGARMGDARTDGENQVAARPKDIDVVVVGGGQAGLSVGYHLARRGLNFVILDASERVGDTWRNRWDSLRLFTPAKFSALDGMPFPAPPYSFPTKDDMAAYLEAYVAKFALPLRNNARVTSLSRDGDRYIVATGGHSWRARQVVVAAASYQTPKTPQLAADLDPRIRQLHSFEYRNPGQLKSGPVLLVGAGNSGAEIARELAPRHRVLLSGPDVGHIPFNIHGFAARHGMIRLVVRGVFHRVMTVRTPPGRKMRRSVLGGHSGPLVRVRPSDLAAAGVERVARVTGVDSGKPTLDDGRVLDVANVIWCTGFDSGLDWIKLPIFDENGHPEHDCGIVRSEPGLTFVGLHFLYALSSSMVHGVGRDARYIADIVARRVGSKRKAA